MLKFIENLENINIERICSLVVRRSSFCISGLTSFLRILLLKYIAQKKKVLFITASEQKALRYQNDLKKLFGQNSEIFPYQDVSMYDGVVQNLYKYAEQLDIINNLDKQDILLVPVKALSERFARKEFFQENSINIKVDEDVDTVDLAKRLVELGYKRSTMVVDIGEFSIRGDIIDIYNVESFPIRIELWGDTVTDIRYFDPSNQRSFKKVREISINPLYKFVVGDNSSNILKSFGAEILDKVENEKYFDGIYISEIVGFNKPDVRFFERIFGAIKDFSPAETLIVGDSLSSDIKGGKNAGVKTCLYNPCGKEISGDVIPDYEIKSLSELPRLLSEL